MNLRTLLRQCMRRVGLEVRRYRPEVRLPLLSLYGVDAIFDVGANVGMSAEGFRQSGFRGRLVSFEPVQHLFEELERRSRSDELWDVERMALGAQTGEADIYVTGGHAGASSLLEMTGNVLKHAPDQAVVRTERVRVSTVDEMVARHYPAGSRLFLKIDVQGFERLVLEGARSSLPRVVGMRLEASLVENYKGESLLTEMLPLLSDLGFRVVAIDRGWDNESTGEIFQVDVTCFRVERALSGGRS